MNADELIPTRWSLICRLKDWNDQVGWREFFDTYWKLIYSVAIKAGLTDAEAQDVVQANDGGLRTNPAWDGLQVHPRFSLSIIEFRRTGYWSSGGQSNQYDADDPSPLAD